MIGNLLHGPGHTLTVAGGQGWTDRDLAGLLRSSGIPCWGLDLDAGSDWTVRVERNRAAHAQQVLEAAGVLLIGGEVATSTIQPRQVRGKSRLWRLLP